MHTIKNLIFENRHKCQEKYIYLSVHKLMSSFDILSYVVSPLKPLKIYRNQVHVKEIQI